MHAVILAAGKGTRLAPLTDTMPKPMIGIGGKPMLAHIMERLPRVVDEIVLAIGYHGEVIRNYFGESFDGRKISYVDASDLTGTAGALWKARDLLRGTFLVMNGDDIFETQDWETLMQHSLAMGVYEGARGFEGYLHIEIGVDENLAGFCRPHEHEYEQGIRICTGAFVLDERIFAYEPVRLRSGEYGLPQTVLLMAADHAVKAIPMPSWHTITTPDDIPRVAVWLASAAQGG